MMGDALGEERGDGISGGFDEAVLQRENELLEKAMTIRSGDKEAVERGLASTITAGGTIFLIRSATYGALLVLAFGESVKTGGTRERPFAFAAETTEREKEINYPLPACGDPTTERGRYRV